MDDDVQNQDAQEGKNKSEIKGAHPENSTTSVKPAEMRKFIQLCLVMVILSL